MYARRKSSSSFCRLVSIPGASSSGHPKRRRGEKQMFLLEALRRPDAGGRSALTILARRCWMRMVAMVLGLALGSAPIVVLADGAGGGGPRVTRRRPEVEVPRVTAVSA